MKKRNRGFTLAELLIVVAIIAVLVAISIPIFTKQLEKSREATDLANIRGKYAEMMTAAISEETPETVTLNLKQTKAGWDTASAQDSLVSLTKNHVVGAPADGANSATLEWLASDEAIQVTFSGEAVNTSGTSGAAGAGDVTGNATQNYIENPDDFSSIVVGVAKAAYDLLQGLTPEQMESAKAWYLGGNCGSPDQTSSVNYKAMQLDTMTSRALYEDSDTTRHYWTDLYKDTDITTELLAQNKSGYMSEVYFDLDSGLPIAAGYFKTGNSGSPYVITYLNSGEPAETVQLSGSSGYRYWYAYNKDKALSSGTVLNQ